MSRDGCVGVYQVGRGYLVLKIQPRCPRWVLDMALSGERFNQIQEALLDAFRSASDLAIMVRIELNENLNTITHGSNLKEMIFSLVEWADANGRIEQLISGAHEYNSGNQKLRLLIEQNEFVSEKEMNLPEPVYSKDSIIDKKYQDDNHKPLDVFLSYSRHDSEFMLLIRDEIQNAGFTVWNDESELVPGTPSWQRAIEDNLNRARCLVVILSPDAKASEWVGIEIGYAKLIGLNVFPILYRGVPLDSVPIALINTQWMNLHEENLHEIGESLIPALEQSIFAEHRHIASDLISGSVTANEPNDTPSLDLNLESAPEVQISSGSALTLPIAPDDEIISSLHDEQTHAEPLPTVEHLVEDVPSQDGELDLEPEKHNSTEAEIQTVGASYDNWTEFSDVLDRLRLIYTQWEKKPNGLLIWSISTGVLGLIFLNMGAAVLQDLGAILLIVTVLQLLIMIVLRAFLQ